MLAAGDMIKPRLFHFRFCRGMGLAKKDEREGTMFRIEIALNSAEISGSMINSASSIGDCQSGPITKQHKAQVHYNEYFRFRLE